MHFFVQSARGVLPAHLNKLSPSGIRGTFLGFICQIGNLLAAANATIQSAVAGSLGGDCSWPLAGVAAVVMAVLVAFGREARHTRMGVEALPESAPARPIATPIRCGGPRRSRPGRSCGRGARD